MTETLSHAIARRVMHLNPDYAGKRVDVPAEVVDELIIEAAWKIRIPYRPIRGRSVPITGVN